MFKKFAIVLVTLFAFGGTVSAYAWWDTLQEEQLDQQLTIGVGTDLSITVTADDGALTLVPAEALLGASDTKSYEFSYTLVLSKQLAVDATLNATVSNITVGGNANPGAITVTPTYDTTNINADSPVIVTLTVTMANIIEADYATYANKVIEFDVTFNAS